ncbi:hypothetical protein Tco_1164400 [Tanacetum coccineum]
MVESLPTMVDTHIKEQVKKKVPEQVRDQVPVYVAEGLILERQKTKEEMERMIAKAILQERGSIQAKITLQIQNAVDNHIPSQVDTLVRSYMSGHILHVHPVQSQTAYVPEQQYQLYLSMKVDPQLQQSSTVRPRDHDDPYDDAHPKGENRNQEHVDDYDFWTDSYASNDDEIPMKQVSQDIMEEVSLTIDESKLKKMANETSFVSEERKFRAREDSIVTSQVSYNYLNDDDIKERTSRWKEPRKPKEEVYSNSKIIHVIKTYWELGHENKFIAEIVARRANECIVSITELDYMNLNKNDIEDMYLLIMNGKVPDNAETGLLCSLSVFIRRVEKHKMFSIIYEPVHGIIYKNSKNEKRVMRHSQVHKFCDAMLNRVLKGLKSYNNDVKYDYVQKELTNDEVEYLKLFEEEIEVRLKYRNQMRRWDMYVNGRPLGPRREHPE